MNKHAAREILLVFLIVWGALAIWALVKPPFQAPDEFVHYVKALSTTKALHTPQVCVEIDNTELNPLAELNFLHILPFHGERPLLKLEQKIAQNLDWVDRAPVGNERLLTSAYTYPYPFYATLNYLSRQARSAFALTPYQSHYFDRLIVASLAAFLWTIFYLILFCSPLAEFRRALTLFLLLNPVLLFISSSINPDAILYPLASIATLATYWTMLNCRRWPLFALSITACLLVKRPTLLILAANLTYVLLLCVFSQKTRSTYGRSCIYFALSCCLALASSYYLFYRTNTVAVGMPIFGAEESLLTYARSLWLRAPTLFVGYWGLLGWTDYGPPQWLVYLVAAALILNTVAFLQTHTQRIGAKYIALFCVFFIHVFFLLVMEYYFFSQTGYILQGRYFLPLSFCLALLMLVGPEYRFWKYLTLATFLVANLYLLNATVTRYYEGSWLRVYRALPFVAAPELSARKLKAHLEYTDILHCKD